MKKTIYIILLTILTCSLHAQGLYKNTEDGESPSGVWAKSPYNSEEYSPSILRAKPDTPPGPGEDETALPVSGGMLLLAALAGARYAVHGARRRVKN